MSLFLKTPKKMAEVCRKKIMSAGAFDNSHELARDKDFVYFPLTKKIRVAGCRLVSKRGVERKRRPKSLSAALTGVLSETDLSLIPTSFDVVGDIAILEFEAKFTPAKKKVIARALLSTFPNIRVAAEKTRKVSGKYRVRGVKHLAGEKRTRTVHTEYGCKYNVDVARDYFSPRLGVERMRVATQVKKGERVLVLFAGVGPYAILIAKKQEPSEVVAVELNPSAAASMRENARLNKVRLKVVEADARNAAKKLGEFDRIIMPLPKDAGDFLKTTLPALAPGGIVNFYTFAHDKKEAGENPKKKIIELGRKTRVVRTVECGSYSPCLNRYCVDFKIL